MTGRWPSHVAAAHAALPQVVLACVTRDSGAGGLHNRGGAEGHFLLWRSCGQTRSPHPVSLHAFHVVLAVPVNLSEPKASRCREPSVGPACAAKTDFAAPEPLRRPLRSGAELELARLAHRGYLTHFIFI